MLLSIDDGRTSTSICIDTQTLPQHRDLAPNGLTSQRFGYRKYTISERLCHRLRASDLSPSSVLFRSRERCQGGYAARQQRQHEADVSALGTDEPSYGCLVASLPRCLVALSQGTLRRGLAGGRRLYCSSHRLCLKRGGNSDDACRFIPLLPYCSGETTPLSPASFFIDPFLVQAS